MPWWPPPGPYHPRFIPPLASFFGFRSRTLIFLASFFCAILFLPICYFGLFFSLCCVSENRTRRGKVLPPDSDPFDICLLCGVRAHSVKAKNVGRYPTLRCVPMSSDSSSRKAVNISSACTTNRFPSRRASVIQIWALLARFDLRRHAADA